MVNLAVFWNMVAGLVEAVDHLRPVPNLAAGFNCSIDHLGPTTNHQLAVRTILRG